LAKYRRESVSERDKGMRFEQLIQAYLLTDPKYNNFSAKDDFGGHDVDIDLVAQTFDGEFWEVQCKRYQEGNIIDKPVVDAFLATSSRTFTCNSQTFAFAHRFWISTTNKWNSNAEEPIRNQNPPVN